MFAAIFDFHFINVQELYHKISDSKTCPRNMNINHIIISKEHDALALSYHIAVFVSEKYKFGS